jgi:hypothetical protein
MCILSAEEILGGSGSSNLSVVEIGEEKQGNSGISSTG